VRVGVLGVGSIGSYLIDRICEGVAGPLAIVGVTDVPGTEGRLREIAGRIGARWSTNALDLVDFGAELVIEAAAQAAVRQHAIPLLNRGVDLLLMSVGALADPPYFEAVKAAAKRNGRRVYLPSGAIGGLDAIRSAAIEGLDDVTLITSKPPAALAGAPFFESHQVDLDAIKERTVIYEGPAIEAVRLFPANVNVAAALSLAGIGPERTRMQVVADPALDRNVHEVVARGAFGELRLQFSNVPSPSNPKTSFLACLSPLATLRRLSDPVQFG
jgi:aspartate dehydrogenase